MDQIDNLIPPSLKTLFHNFDLMLECGGPLQNEPFILRAITLQGMPVDDMPRIDIWDNHGILFSSHPTTDSKDKEEKQNENDSQDEPEKASKQTSMWTDEEGFYRVNKSLKSDFLLLCRFGGQYAHDTRDPTKVIFRYANNTSFLYNGPLALHKKKVDIMRRYNDSVPEEDFLISLLFDRFEQGFELKSHQTNSTRPLDGVEALHRGWELMLCFRWNMPNVKIKLEYTYLLH